VTTSGYAAVSRSDSIKSFTRFDTPHSRYDEQAAGAGLTSLVLPRSRYAPVRRFCWSLPGVNAIPDEAITSSRCLVVRGLEAAALKPWINPSSHIGPQPDVYGQQGVDFEPAQLPSLFTQFRDRLPREASELKA
jgi:hypothetical protein